MRACCLLLGGQQVLRSCKTVTKGSDILTSMYVASSIHFPFTTGVYVKVQHPKYSCDFVISSNVGCVFLFLCGLMLLFEEG